MDVVSAANVNIVNVVANVKDHKITPKRNVVSVVIVRHASAQ